MFNEEIWMIQALEQPNRLLPDGGNDNFEVKMRDMQNHKKNHLTDKLKSLPGSTRTLKTALLTL